MDSEPFESEDFAGPGEVYQEADESYWRPIQEGVSVITGEVEDRWGTWVSVLVPVSGEDRPAAVLGLDYPSTFWHRQALASTFLPLMTILAALALLLALSRRLQLRSQELESQRILMEIENRLHRQEAMFTTLYEEVPLGISIGRKDQFLLEANACYERILGRPLEEIKRLGWLKYTHPEDVAKDAALMEAFNAGENQGYSLEKRYLRPDGSSFWVNMTIAPLSIGTKEERYHFCLIQDIDAQVRNGDILARQAQSMKVLMSNLPGMAYRCLNDSQWTMKFVSDGCQVLTGYPPEALLDNHLVSFNDLILPEYREGLRDLWDHCLSSGEMMQAEYRIRSACGGEKWVYEQGQGIFNPQGQVIALEGMTIDICKLKEKEAEIEFLSNHDFLTGLPNRRYFEKEKQRLNQVEHLPLSLLIADVDGLKMINDGFGHEAGDVLIQGVASVLKEACREGDVLARTGGDEFTFLLPQTDYRQAHDLIENIKKGCAAYHKKTDHCILTLHCSMGCATKDRQEQDMNHVIKEAEDRLYRRKLLEQNSSHSAILNSIKQTLEEKCHETQSHAQRLVDVSRRLGERVGLTGAELDDLALLANLHDIGKVVIDDRILKKPGSLTAEEWEEMKKHPQIGYRIALASPELVGIANHILSHHERWDGTGYPKGLKGKQIPLLARIIAIADAFDAMTQERPYRRALPEEMALEEIRQGAGSQFDPELAQCFLEIFSGWKIQSGGDDNEKKL